MAITVKHTKVSTIPDTTDTSLIRPSDWNADHTLVGTIDVANGGTGASTLTGYVKGNGTSAMTASATVPSTDITGLGTMSTQNANAVAITGGTINGTTIGATTPSTVNATTITGQTGVLRGTGQNLVVRSEDFSNASWGKTSVTVTANSTTAPDGTTTADTLAATSADSACFQGVTTSSVGLTYTFSVYLRADVATNISIAFYDTPTYNVTLAACAVTTSWQRFSVTRTLASSATGIQATIGGNSTFSTGESVYAWGAQVELGSTANTYIPTTTTAVYGTPTLSFSGVSEIGLLSTGALYLQPAGTGAIQAQATTSTTAGGNARGANAVDWQTIRTSASSVASGSYSVIGGGYNNKSNGFAGYIGGGLGNSQNGGSYGLIAGGALNTIGTVTEYATIVGGYSNTANGYLNFIGAGYSNSGTSNSAVTTQSGTMNATTAVTLSGSNANIKVGQLITGTSINSFPYTYVAAISGTSLTLSQVASGSSTSTLSFFTPHGVVVGGGNNQATGSYSFIGGGGDAGTAANRNVASGDWSFVGGGRGNTASSNYSFVGGGGGNSATTNFGSVVCGGGFFGNLPTQFSGNAAQGTSAFVGAGFSNIASGFGASVVGGNTNYATSTYSAILGGYSGTTRGIIGYQVFPAHNGPIATTQGSSQAALLIIGAQTTDATATALRSDTSAAGTTNQVILPNNSAYFFTGEVVSGVTGGGNTKGWTIEGVIKRGANAASTALVGTPTVTSTYADAGASTWVIAVTADTTNGGLRVTFTGQAATTIRTVCQIRTTEMTY